MPVCVTPCSTSIDRAMPKSVTFASPSSVTSTFCGFTSRWTRPVLCANASASATCSPELDRTPRRQRPGAIDELLQALAVDVLEDDVLLAVGLAAVDDRDDVRMRELRDGARLAPEPLDVLGVIAVMRVEDFQCDVALEQRVDRAVDRGHAAGADDLLGAHTGWRRAHRSSSAHESYGRGTPRG